MITQASIWGALTDSANNGVFWGLVNAGAPTNGTSGTGANLAGPGCLLIDTTNKILYQNTNTKASPTWTAVAGGGGGNVTLTGIQTLTNKTLTAPTITAPTITGTSTIGAGMTITSPTLVTPALGVATATSINASGNVRGASFNAGATAGVTAGPFTTISSITVVGGIVTALTGS